MLATVEEKYDNYLKQRHAESIPFVGGPYIWAPDNLFEGKKYNYLFKVYYYYSEASTNIGQPISVPKIDVLIEGYAKPASNLKKFIKGERNGVRDKYMLEEYLDFTHRNDEEYPQEFSEKDIINISTDYFEKLINELPGNPDNYNEIICALDRKMIHIYAMSSESNN